MTVGLLSVNTIKMKNLTFLILLLFSFGALSAQSAADCPANLSIFAEFAKVKNYDSAYTPWLEVKTHCPELNEATYIYGERILGHKIKNEEDNTEYISILNSLYDDWLTYFPNDRAGKSQRGKILAAKAQSMLEYETAPLADIYAIFDDAFTSNTESFTNPKALYNYFKTLYTMYKNGDENVTMDALFSKYEDVSEKFAIENQKLSRTFDRILKKEDAGESLTSRDKRSKRIAEINSRANSTYANNLDAIISQEASCDNLIPLYRSNFDENKTDEKWLKRAASRMDAKECSDDPLFVELVEALHSLSPSADSAYYLGILKDKAGNTTEAIAFYEESLTLESDAYRKAEILYKIAAKLKKRGLKSQARKYANQALANKPSMGKAYILIGGLYADSANDCGNNQFEKQAVYWLAAQTARRAAIVDPSLKKTSQKLEASYSGRAPSKTDIFTQGKAGEVISFDCWIRSTVTVPNL
jgi:tetratricopeptide (TPR) repeat protein